VYEVTIKKSFSAAHTLTEIGGNCEELHGHNFTVEVSVSSHMLSDDGILIDFRILKQWTDDILKEMDHKYLNDIPYFKDSQPSSENIAKYIYDRITTKACQHNLSVTNITVWEAEDARASYRGEK
jgi:6-pyruvoyltetrahydropterin/6-carboxytetrahydropterin synthase